MSSADQFSLEGKTAFVTGASYGLGVGFARALAEAGANVVLAARSVDKLTDVATQLDGLGVKTPRTALRVAGEYGTAIRPG